MGIWRIPVDEIDRPGSFASHMNRSVVLLLNVLSQLKDSNTLLKISSMLQRTPDLGKKYLRDADRQVLAQRAFVLTVKVLEDTLDDLTGVSEDQNSKRVAAGGMTTDISHKATAEDSKEVLPKRAALADRTAHGVENGVKTVSESLPTQPMDTGDQACKASKYPTSAPRSATAEPMELGGHAYDSEKCFRAAGNQAQTVRMPKDKSLENRTPELSLEELSISSKQQLQVAREAAQSAHADQSLQRPSRKRKLLLDDTESSKTLLLDAYRVWQQGQKVMSYDLAKIEKLMSETYMLIKQVDEDAALEQAIKFCQAQMGASMQKQSAGDAPSTPKHIKESRDAFFPLTPVSVLLTPINTELVTTESVLRIGDLSSKTKPASSSSSSSSASSSVLVVSDTPKDPEQQRGVATKTVSSMSYLTHEDEELAVPLENIGFQPQETRLCQQMKMATVTSSSIEQTTWKKDVVLSTSAGRCCSQASSSKAEMDSSTSPMGTPQSKADSPRIKTRIPPNMPKLFIPSTVTKFPPEITVTPPTPTLLSPKGSVSEETKQKLKSVILSAQSAANVKKGSLCQPALEILETSSQESSLESDTDEDDDYMDI